MSISNYLYVCCTCTSGFKAIFLRLRSFAADQVFQRNIEIDSMRIFRSIKIRRISIIFIVCAIYILLLFLCSNIQHQLGMVHSKHDGNKHSLKSDILANAETDSSFKFSTYSGETFYVERILTNYGLSLKEKMECKTRKGAKPKLLVSTDQFLLQHHFGGCPDWNCRITSNQSQIDSADAVLLSYMPATFKSSPNRYTIFFTQESPKNAMIPSGAEIYLNMTLGFRHDSPTASPYGYTVKLAPQSYRKAPFANETLIRGKTKGAAWFVSHCATKSGRENIVSELQKYYPVDIYGRCGTLTCERGGSCENMLNTDYNFYLAFENSICKDYNTEKLWNLGYQKTIIPIVLKRSIVEPFVPPHSFIAVDDFETLQDMAKHLTELTSNRTAYLEYFKWREQYKVIFLDGNHHDVMERPWGFCQVFKVYQQQIKEIQLCRLMWETPKKHYTIDDMNKYWFNSCEEDGKLADKIISTTRAKVGKTLP